MGLIDRFTGIKLGDLTPSQLESVGNNLVLSSSSLKDLQELTTLANAFTANSGVSAGMVRGLGGLSVKNLTDDNASAYTVPANQSWSLIGIEYFNADAVNISTVEVYLTDGTNRFYLFNAAVAPLLRQPVDLSIVLAMPIILSPELYLEVKQDGVSSQVDITLAYQVKQI